MKNILALLIFTSGVASINLTYLDQVKPEMMIDIDQQTEAQQQIYIQNQIQTN